MPLTMNPTIGLFYRFGRNCFRFHVRRPDCLVYIIFAYVMLSGCVSPNLAPVDEGLLVNEDEKIIWRQSLKEQTALNTSGAIFDDQKLQTYLSQIVRNLQPSGHEAKISFSVFVVKDPCLNAFAFPTGAIYVHTGILARLDNEAQLAALLAHEMAHCTQRHALRAFRAIMDKPAFIASVEHLLAGFTMVQEVARCIGWTGSLAAISGYNRTFETEADCVGLDALVMAGYDSYEALSLFKHLQKEITEEQIEEPYIFGSHPKVQERIDTIRQLLETTYQGQRSGIKNTEVFLAMIAPAILENARLDLRRGRFEVAQRTVEKYLRTVKADAHAYFLMGEIFRQRGRENDTEQALFYHHKAVAMDPSYAEPLKAIGFIHFKKGRMAQAQKYFESCLLLAPDIADKTYIQGYIKQCMTNGEG